MFIDFSLLIFGGVAALSLASTAACATQCLSLKKRLQAVESRGPSGEEDFSGDYQALASRVSSIQNSVAVLQSSIAELQESVSTFNARPESARPANDNLLAEPSRPAGSDRRKSRFKAEWDVNTPINLNPRGQMLRMHRRGETVPAIASALGISQGEVKLTLRMQELHSDRPEKENSLDRL